jgi:hypothetical protein
MVKAKKKESQLEKLKDQYASMGEFFLAIPNDMMIFKQAMEIRDRQSNTMNDTLILVYELAPTDKRNTHYSERTLAFMHCVKDGVVRKVDQEKLRKELGGILLKHFEKKPFIEDLVITLSPPELIEAYDRAVIKKGKVKQVEGCSKFLIHGAKGKPMQLMLRQ